MKQIYLKYGLICIALLPLNKVVAQGFEWAASAGSTMADVGYSIAADSLGNVYTTGLFTGTVDFDPGAGVYNLTSSGETDIFISKLDASGNFVWAVGMGGTSFDGGFSITLDASGDVYATGNFFGSATFGPNTLVSAGNYDIFVVKLDSLGNIVWAKNMGGILADQGNSIGVDASGNVYTTGYYQDTADFDPDAVGINNLISQGAEDVFISKLDASGNFLWAASMGGTGSDIGNSLTLDASDDVLTTGSFELTADFDPGPGVQNLVSAGGTDIFISKLDASGNFNVAKAMGGSENDEGKFITLDGSGNVHTTGFFEGTADFDPGIGVNNRTSAGGKDIYLSKFNMVTNSYKVKAMGGPEDDIGNALAFDPSGTIFLTGSFKDTADFDPGAGVHNLVSAGLEDFFLVKFRASGSFLNAKNVGSTGNDSAYGMAIDTSGNVYTSGSFNATVDFDPTAGTTNLTSLGDFDIFVQKL